MQKYNAEDLLNSVNGFDEIAVKNRWGMTPNALALEMKEGSDPFPLMRVLVFIAKRREGLSDIDAYNEIMNIPNGSLSDYFEEAEEEVFPDEPVTVLGKDA